LKIFFLLSLFVYSLFAAIEFKETKYMAALDFEIEKYGSLKMTDDTLTLVYTKPKKETIIYTKNKIIIKDGTNIKEYTFEKYPQAQYMGLILRAIIKEEFHLIESFFKIKKDNEITTLSAKPAVSSYMENIEIIKKENKKRIIVLRMLNDDKVTIETFN